jgi:hypothetical protein
MFHEGETVTTCPNCSRCLPLVVSGETVQDVYELELIDEDVTTRPVLVVVVKTEGAALQANPAKESHRATPN